MARSPLTLAAALTSAVPRASVVSVAALTEHATARFDTAVAELSDGRRLVVRAAAAADAAAELREQARALQALTSGVRALLTFRAPTLHGQTTLDGQPVLVTDLLPGYRVDAAHVPAGRGAATSLGASIAAVHALPESVAVGDGLPALDPEQVRAGVSRLLDRVATSHRVPVSLLARWSRAVAADRLWRFEPALTLGGAAVESFLFEDRAGVPTVTGLLEWRGLGVGDPAVDLRWTSGAPQAAADVFEAYLTASARTPDAALRARARLYAELEFAKWLMHGHDEEREDIVTDAANLLGALADAVVGDDLLAEEGADVDEAIALLGRVPQPGQVGGDTSMQTDAFDPGDTAFLRDEPLEADRDAPDAAPGAATTTPEALDPTQTEPLSVSDWVGSAEDDSAADGSEPLLRH